MPQIQGHCVDCQGEIKLQIGQAVINHAQRLHTSYICLFCGAAVEADDIGFPPDEIRQLILSEEGERYLVIEESESKRVAAVKILRQALDLSLRSLFTRPHLICCSVWEVEQMVNKTFQFINQIFGVAA